MIFTNPWGLLALLSTAVILGLHFFRSHRQTREIGGLHLWQFAMTRQPIGSRLTRVWRNLSLLFQLLAAVLLSLLIAGIDFPRRDSASHYTIILDDTASMTAQGEESPADRVRQVLDDWSDARSRFTVVAAGRRARVLAGPYVERDEMLRRLESWRPHAPTCDVAQAVQLASRFVTGGEKMLFLTDHPDQAEEYVNLLEILGVGEPLANAAIVFADRVRISPDRDRVFVTLQAYGPQPTRCRIEARAGDQVIYESVPPRELSPNVPDGFSFDISLLESPIQLVLDPDALAADNRVVLAPVPVRNIRVHGGSLEPLDRYLVRAVESIPFAYMEPDPLRADLIFSQTGDFPPPRVATGGPAAAQPGGEQAAEDVIEQSPFPRPLLDKYASAALICALPEGKNESLAGVARGVDIVPDGESLITQGLPLEEGILWPFIATHAPSSCYPLLATATAPLLFGGPIDISRATHRECYYLNILSDRTNIYQTSAWPVLIRNLVEHTRRIVPGMARTNYRLGEQVLVSLEPTTRLRDGGAVDLLRNGERYERFVGAENLPRILDDLDVGMYDFVVGGEQPLASFSINFFAPAESDLTGARTSHADLSELEPGRLARESSNHRLFLVLTLLVISLTGLSWIFQDSSR